MAGHQLPAGPRPAGEDHVHVASLVLEIDEDGPPGRLGMLAVRHHPGHHDPLPVPATGQGGRGHHPHGLEPLPGQVHGGLLGGQSQRPQVIAHRVVLGRAAAGGRLDSQHDAGQAIRRALRCRAGSPELAAS